MPPVGRCSVKEKGAGADDEDRVEFEPLLVLLPDGIFGGVERGVS